MPVHVVEPGTVVRLASTGEERIVGDDNFVMTSGVVFLTRPNAARFEHDRDRFGGNLTVPK